MYISFSPLLITNLRAMLVSIILLYFLATLAAAGPFGVGRPPPPSKCLSSALKNCARCNKDEVRKQLEKGD